MKKVLKEKTLSETDMINVKHITKLPGEKRKQEYTVMDLKKNITMGKIFVSHHCYHLHFLKQHRQQILTNL